MAQPQPDSPISERSYSDQECEALRLDYEQTTQLYRMLADIRFKLLALIPTLAGAATLITADKAKLGPGTVLAVGILGFFATLGIIIYELRNSLFYDLSISRALRLERKLKLPRFTKLRRGLKEPGGVFTERPPGREPYKGPGKQDPLNQKLLRFIPIKHDLGLSFVYGVSLGGWMFIIINTIPLDEPWRSALSLLAGINVAVITMWEFKRLDKDRYEWQFGREGKEKRVYDDDLYKAQNERR